MGCTLIINELVCCLKPRFHYADFATFIETSLRGKSRTQIMKVRDKSCHRLLWFLWLMTYESQRQSLLTLSLTFPMYCNKLNSIRTTRTGLSRTCYRLCCKHLDVSRWFVSATSPPRKFQWKSASWNLGLNRFWHCNEQCVYSVQTSQCIWCIHTKLGSNGKSAERCSVGMHSSLSVNFHSLPVYASQRFVMLLLFMPCIL